MVCESGVVVYESGVMVCESGVRVRNNVDETRWHGSDVVPYGLETVFQIREVHDVAVRFGVVGCGWGAVHLPRVERRGW